MPFKVENHLLGTKVIYSTIYPDIRGYFEEVYKSRELVNYGIEPPVQINMSFSKRGVIRGLHFQRGSKAQGKTIMVVKGRIFDVAVGLSSDDNFGKYASIELSEGDGKLFYIPPGLAHGFQALEDSYVIYMVTHNEYSPSDEACVNWRDEEINIKWPINDAIVSEKDSKCPTLREVKKTLSVREFR
ncbi:dTDP-4-dehydrorhamnose 3,5-epimerase [Sulfolobales archaeon HS-7]|nr:dTDP-4-dehydrorhamnose 3,5-epimerase [Sulfolobales archaeon HS-7]